MMLNDIKQWLKLSTAVAVC